MYIHTGDKRLKKTLSPSSLETQDYGAIPLSPQSFPAVRFSVLIRFLRFPVNFFLTFYLNPTDNVFYQTLTQSIPCLKMPCAGYFLSNVVSEGAFCLKTSCIAYTTRHSLEEASPY